jgi:hypothetical protein
VARAEDIDMGEDKDGSMELLIKEKRSANFVPKNRATKESKELLR